jgi:sulfur-oxidizing protein SoxY
MKRRAFLELTGAALSLGALPAAAQSLKFQPSQDISPLIANITQGAAIDASGVTIELPAIAENGNSVPLHVKVASPMSATDRVEALYIFAERNPRPLVATLHFGKAAARAEISTRMRLAGTQKVTVLAQLSGNRFRSGQLEVLVTSAACLDEAFADT